MGKPISLFSGYSQGENRTTNYCLLLLKMLYEENPKFLAEATAKLAGDSEVGSEIGVKFQQQVYKGSSIPDGLILQSAFTIYIETKNWNWFYDGQLEEHLSSLHKSHVGLKILIALCNFEGENRKKFERIRELCEGKYSGSIVFEDVSFEEFLSALKLPHLPKNLDDAIDEFSVYLEEQGLLPSWKRRLDVINCAGLPDDILVGNVYMCPASGGAYSHLRCKYFGMYRGRRIERVASIEAVVDVEGAETAEIKWRNIERPEAALKKLAISKIQERRPGRFPTRVFLLGPTFETDCPKDSGGPMWASKRYFDIKFLKVNGAEELASAIRGMPWSRFEHEE
jgi:hypothetical protein